MFSRLVIQLLDHRTETHNLPRQNRLPENSDLPRIPLIEDLTRGPVPSGSRFLVEYDPTSEWYNASLTITAGWLRSGGRLAYNVASQPPSNIRLQLSRLRLNAQKLEEDEKLHIYDWYSATLGQKSAEKLKEDSLKVADLSVAFLKETKKSTEPISRSPGGLMIVDDVSSLDRFNEERPWVEFVLTRLIARDPVRPSPQVALIGVIAGLHSERVYKRLEAAFDGIVDLKLDESGEETRNLMRVRSVRNVPFDSRWHPLSVDDKFEVTLKN